jgi:hypothetical protein
MVTEHWLKTITIGPPLAPALLRRAAIAVAARATSPDDLRELLDALDLTTKGD